MSIELYDNAVLNKFQEVYPNTVYAPTDRALEYASEVSETKQPKFPLISLYRQPFSIMIENVHMKEYKQGRKSRQTEEKDVVEYLRTLPVEIPWQIDLWCETDKQMSQLIQELVFWLLDEPVAIVKEPNTGQEFHFNLFFSRGEITDDTDVQAFTELGRLHRASTEIYTDEARVFMPYGKFTILEIDWTVVPVEEIKKENWSE